MDLTQLKLFLSPQTYQQVLSELSSAKKALSALDITPTKGVRGKTKGKSQGTKKAPKKAPKGVKKGKAKAPGKPKVAVPTTLTKGKVSKKFDTQGAAAKFIKASGPAISVAKAKGGKVKGWSVT